MFAEGSGFTVLTGLAVDLRLKLSLVVKEGRTRREPESLGRGQQELPGRGDVTEENRI